MRMLHQRLADALGDAAVHLAMNDERVHGAADVVDRDVIDMRDRAGFGIDLDLADVGAIREARLGDGLVAGGSKRPAQILGQVVALLRGARHLEQADRVVGALHGEAAVLEFDVGGGGLQKMLGDAQCPSR